MGCRPVRLYANKRFFSGSEIVNELSAFESHTLDDLEIDIGKQWQIERGLQLAIQNLLQAYHRISGTVSRIKR